MDDVIDRLEQRLAAVAGGVAELREQVPTRAEMNARFDEAPTRAEMSARFDEARRHVELLEEHRRETRLVAEAVAALSERMDRGFAELRELINEDHRSRVAAFLDHERRIRGLEERG